MNLLAEQAHKIALAGPPLAEEPDRQRQLRVLAGNGGGDHRYVGRNLQVVFLFRDALIGVDKVSGYSSGQHPAFDALGVHRRRRCYWRCWLGLVRRFWM